MVSEETLTKITEGLARGEYSLLLGAGASSGAIGGNGEPLPSGPELRDRILAAFGIEAGEDNISLSRAYAAAHRQDPAGLTAFINAWFTGCTPSWQGSLAEFRWNRIWTLNIDDVMETVYQIRTIPFDRFDWTSKFRDSSQAENQIIHLHGYASGPNSGANDSQLVFSTNEYAATVNDRRTWHSVFADLFVEQPFLILGSSLREEFDLSGALIGRSRSAVSYGRPSLIVLNAVSKLEREELESYGLLVIEDDAEHFISILHDKVMEFEKHLADQYGGPFTAKMFKFQQQFKDLRSHQPLAYDDTSKFYSGYEPQWQNILDNDDARMQSTNRVLSAIREAVQQDSMSQQIHVVTGDAGSGKSTGILRVARQLVGDGISVYLFRGEEDLDIESIKQWLQRAPNTVLVFDNCADFADSLMDLADECKSANVKLLALGAERLARRETLLRAIPPSILHMGKDHQYGLLSNHEIDSLIGKLKSRRRLGKITREPVHRQQAYFKQEASRRLFDGMANLEGGQGFKERILTNYRSIQSDRIRFLYSAASIAYSFGYPLPISIAAKLANTNPNQLELLLGNEHRDLLLVDGNRVHPPHRITASIAVETALLDADKATAVFNLAVALAPHVDVPAIRSESLHYRLLRILMRHDTIMRLIGEQEGRRFYENTQEYFYWNGRYWEQRALFESECGNDSKARSYAEHSISVHVHPFAFNTLGTILGRIAIAEGDPSILNEAISTSVAHESNGNGGVLNTPTSHFSRP